MRSLFQSFSLNLHGSLREFHRPVVMGVINITPDSFYASSRVEEARALAATVERMITEGVDIIDVGACSTRPGSVGPTPEQELARLQMLLPVVREIDTRIPLSVDTWRASVARHAVEELGADIVNDVSGGQLDPEMADVVADLHVPYVLTHMRGTPLTMSSLTDYGSDGVAAGVIGELCPMFNRLRLAGVADIIIDPGFGFAKTVEQNYRLLASLDSIVEAFGCPVLVGMSRKSMLTEPLGIAPDEALPATVAANTLALMQGASILRVHDVAAARQAVSVCQLFINQSTIS